MPPSLAERLEWFRDLKFGLFMHWGPYSQWGCLESWPLVEEDTWARADDLPAWVERDRDIEQFKRDYYALNRTFNPTEFDPQPWVAAAKRAGMQYVVFTTKHHDGFCMFDTRQTDYRITHPNCPFSADPRANIADGIFSAFRAEGFGIGVYFSKSDWHCPWYWSPDRPARTRNPNYDTAAEPDKWEQFVQFVHGQIEELMTGYGPVDILWLDGGQVRPPSQDIRMDEIARMARRHQPGLIIADRTVGGEHENYLTPEQEVPDEPLLEKPWESCITMGDQWSFKPNDNYKSARDLIHLLIGVVAKGGNLLLNVGPQPDGRFPGVALSRLAEIGDWMDVNAEAIHGTRPWSPFEEGQLRFTFSTRPPGHCYAIYLAAEGEEHPPPEIILPQIAHPLYPIHMLGVERRLEGCLGDDLGTVVRIPDEVIANPPCQHAWVLKIREAG
jgi:alpha-L-fucosidase